MTGTFLGLDNGLRVHLLEIPGLPLVNFHVVVGSGSSHDPVGKEGLSDFVCDMLRKGTSRRTAPQIADEIDYLGAEVDADTDLDSSHVTAEFLSRDLQTGLALLAETLIEPAFSPDEVDRLREEKLSDLRAIRDNPSALASRRLIEVLFEGHPYGHPRTGWERTVSTIGRDDVAGLYSRRYVPDDAILVAAGEFDISKMPALIERHFGGWKGTRAAEEPIPDPQPPPRRRVYLVDKPDSTQSQIRVGGVGIDRNDPDYIPIMVANTILGGGFTSRLVQEIRVNQGLSYGAGSRFHTPKRDGAFTISTFTRNETTLQAIQVALEVLAKFREEGGTAEEVDKARKYLKGGFAIEHQTAAAQAAAAAEVAFYGLPGDYYDTYLDRIAAVTVDDVRRVARRIPGDQTLIVVLGEESAIRADLEKLGPLTTRTSSSCT